MSDIDPVHLVELDANVKAVIEQCVKQAMTEGCPQCKSQVHAEALLIIKDSEVRKRESCISASFVVCCVRCLQQVQEDLGIGDTDFGVRVDVPHLSVGQP